MADGIGDDSLQSALHGGEEYELLFTVRPDRRIPKQIAGVPITQIGEIIRGRQMKLAKADRRTEISSPPDGSTSGKRKRPRKATA